MHVNPARIADRGSEFTWVIELVNRHGEKGVEQLCQWRYIGLEEVGELVGPLYPTLAVYIGDS